MSARRVPNKAKRPSRVAAWTRADALLEARRNEHVNIDYNPVASARFSKSRYSLPYPPASRARSVYPTVIISVFGPVMGPAYRAAVLVPVSEAIPR